MPIVFGGTTVTPQRPLPYGAGSYNGVGWGPGTQIQVVEFKGLEESPTVATNDRKRALKHGANPGTDTLEARTITAIFVVLGQDNADLRTLLSQIERAWVPADNVDRVLWLYNSSRYLLARTRPRSFIHYLGGRERVARVQVEWYAANPIYRGADQSVAVGPALGVAGVVPVTNDGVYAAPLVVQVLGAAASPFVVTNQSLGKTLQVNRALGSADVLELDTDMAWVKVNGGFADPDLDTSVSSWWDLAPGTNQIAANRPARLLFSAAWP